MWSTRRPWAPPQRGPGRTRRTPGHPRKFQRSGALPRRSLCPQCAERAVRGEANPDRSRITLQWADEEVRSVGRRLATQRKRPPARSPRGAAQPAAWHAGRAVAHRHAVQRAGGPLRGAGETLEELEALVHGAAMGGAASNFLWRRHGVTTRPGRRQRRWRSSGRIPRNPERVAAAQGAGGVAAPARGGHAAVPCAGEAARLLEPAVRRLGPGVPRSRLRRVYAAVQ
mmetsp:Transcript_100884/g.274313  ORF Transcript_100884/g.274313 Transcript_100884/m.274313 type:complete len:227 (-) Transcript_100884:25-705(-)